MNNSSNSDPSHNESPLELNLLRPESKRVLTVSRTDSQESLSDWGRKKSNLILAKIRKFKSLPNLTRIFAMKRFQRGKRSEENILFVTKGRFVPIPHANLGEQFKRDLQTLCIKNITSWVSQQILWHCHKQRALAIRFYKINFLPQSALLIGQSSILHIQSVYAKKVTDGGTHFLVQKLNPSVKSPTNNSVKGMSKIKYEREKQVHNHSFRRITRVHLCDISSAGGSSFATEKF